MIKKRYILLSLTSGLLITMLLANSAVASNQLEQRIKLLEKLDMLDSLDFQDLINAANECTVQRNFDCSRNKISQADKLAATKNEKKGISLAMTNLNSEIEQVRLEEIARQEELARIERERIRQEQLRLARVEEERRRKQAKEDDNLGKWLGVGARMLGSGLGASAAGTSFDTQAWSDISAGAMEDSMGGGTGMSSTTAALNKTAQRQQTSYGNAGRNNNSKNSSSSERTPSKFSYTFICPASGEHTIPVPYFTQACLSAAKEFARVQVCNEVGNYSKVENACLQSCGDSQCIEGRGIQTRTY